MTSYPKGEKEGPYRATRRRRQFQGNQFTTEEGEPNGASASAKKIATASVDDVPVDISHRYRIIEFVTVFSVLSDLLR